MRFHIVNFPDPYRKETVAPGEKKVIWYEKTQGHSAAFITEFGNNWYPDTYIMFVVDGELVEKLQKVTGDLEGYSFEPMKKDPPIIGRNFVKFTAVNQSNAVHNFEVYCNGYFARPK